MTNLVIPMEGIRQEHMDIIGGKAYSLHRLFEKSFRVPAYFCVTTEAYNKFLDCSGLKGRLMIEFARKDFSKMRWEEMWDAGLRIRNMFMNTPIPPLLVDTIKSQIPRDFLKNAVVVRSSAPGEDSSKTSFAGLHESYVNVTGIDEILENIKLVWASLWSDAAILYRQELGLDIEHSSMAVMVQEMIEGDVSGIVFSTDPNNADKLTIEAIHGLNKGLVEGDVEPDRWQLDKFSGSMVQHIVPSSRDRIVSLSKKGTAIKSIPQLLFHKTPLTTDEVTRIYEMAISSEKIFGLPQDMEWTIINNELYTLQSRPITNAQNNEKQWYISLKRTFENLKQLRNRIEQELIPAMISEANALSGLDLHKLNNVELAAEISRRQEIYQKWDETYTKEFIPFAHGMRLFGQVYNDVMKPQDPYEFVDLLADSKLLSVQRNEQLRQMAELVRNDTALRKKVENNILEGKFKELFDNFMDNFARSAYVTEEKDIIRLILEIAFAPVSTGQKSKDLKKMEMDFLSNFTDEEREWASQLLDMGRASYRLRDDDNIYLGRIEGQYLSSLREGKIRLEERDIKYEIENSDVIAGLYNASYIPPVKPIQENLPLNQKATDRQIQGQPAGKGSVTGIARVINENTDLFNIHAGEILVCDSIDPNMTFVIPLTGGIVERRGGMLIHGAIIAREYGIPCVTGIPDAISIIKTGDEVTVDGNLGIVVIHRH
ncbi:PEP/pyruvate-binding domain-containing protein [Methanohalophilus sp.]